MFCQIPKKLFGSMLTFLGRFLIVPKFEGTNDRGHLSKQNKIHKWKRVRSLVPPSTLLVLVLYSSCTRFCTCFVHFFAKDEQNSIPGKKQTKSLTNAFSIRTKQCTSKPCRAQFQNHNWATKLRPPRFFQRIVNSIQVRITGCRHSMFCSGQLCFVFLHGLHDVCFFRVLV